MSASFPMIFYFWPSMLTFLLCGILQSLEWTSPIAIGWWALGGIAVASGMALRFPDFGSFSFGVMVSASATGGFVSSVFIYFQIKRLFRIIS